MDGLAVSCKLCVVSWNCSDFWLGVMGEPRRGEAGTAIVKNKPTQVLGANTTFWQKKKKKRLCIFAILIYPGASLMQSLDKCFVVYLWFFFLEFCVCFTTAPPQHPIPAEDAPGCVWQDKAKPPAPDTPVMEVSGLEPYINIIYGEAECKQTV